MSKKECPSCAMVTDSANTVCPVCGYEFTDKRNDALKWIALLLAILLLLIIFFF